jgi:RimJ/RimL family protein N-acetyltransferase
VACDYCDRHALSCDGAPSLRRKPILTGRKTTLRPFRDEDLSAIAEALADSDVLRLTGSVHTSAEAANQQATIDDRLRQWYGSRNHQTDRLDLAVLDNATALCVGEVVLNQWDEANDSCNFRILLGPTGRNRGLGTEATRLLLGHAFTVLDLHRVSLEVYAFNPRAQHVYEKAGFTVEGIKRDALRFDGQRVNAVMMSLLAPEWTAPYMP